ncbi:MAG: glycosyltransferase [Thermoanaerobaculia bacterium]
MRIGLVIPGGVDPSGEERVIPALLWLIERLARRHEVHVFSLFQLTRAQTFSFRGAHVHDLGFAGHRRSLPGFFLWSSGRALRKEIAQAGPFDVLHAFWADTTGALASEIGRGLGVPVLVSLGGGELVSLPSIGYGGASTLPRRLLVQRTLARADRLSAASEEMRQSVQALGLPCELVPLGADAALFHADVARPEGPPWRLVHVADLNPVKDQPTLLRALRWVVDREASVHLDVLGQDTLGGAIQSLAAELRLQGHVTFHGRRTVGQLVPFYRGAHLLVHSSLHEAGPLVVLEAALAGLPAVGTAVGTLADLAPERAVAVPPGDAEALGAAILSLLRDAPRRRALARRAQQWALAHDADFTARRFEEIYRELVEGRG